MPHVETDGDTSRWMSKCGPASGTENRSTPPPTDAGGVTGVAAGEGAAVTTGVDTALPPVSGIGATDGDGVTGVEVGAAVAGLSLTGELHAAITETATRATATDRARTRVRRRAARERIERYIWKCNRIGRETVR